MRLLKPASTPLSRFAFARKPGTSPWALSVLLVSAIAVGSILGTVSPRAGDLLSGGVDATVFALMCLLLFEVCFSDLRRLRSAPRFLLVAWCANFILIPTIGFAVASLFLTADPVLFTGLLIFFAAPCTDWFLGFTRLAGGNTALGAVLHLTVIRALLIRSRRTAENQPCDSTALRLREERGTLQGAARDQGGSLEYGGEAR